MFLSLLKIEFKQTLKSLIYYIYIVIFLLFITAQMGDSEWVNGMSEPQKGMDFYGITRSNDETVIMEKTLTNLFKECYYEKFVTYPFMFYKSVVLNEDEMVKVKQELQQCTGKGFEELVNYYMDYYETDETSESDYMLAMKNQYAFSIPISDGLTYDKFLQSMNRVCKIIGTGSSYEEKRLKDNAEVPMTYEDAMIEFQDICQKDKITRAYMRIFCDYAGIILALLPIFIGVSRCLRDRRAKVTDVIYAKSVSSTNIILSRYLANVILIFLPVVITAFFCQLPYQYHATTINVTPDYFAFISYSVIWLLPEILVVLAVSFFITELTENVLAIFIQVFWGIGSLLASNALIGEFGLNLITRWNSIGKTALYLEQQSELYWNKGFYVSIAIIIMLLTIIVYWKKRKEGTTIYGKIFKPRR